MTDVTSGRPPRAPSPGRAPPACLLAACLLASCGGDGDGARADDACAPARSYELSQAFAEHACLHAQFGPFEAVGAPPDGAAPAELRNTHIAYQVTIPLSESGLGERSVSYEPKVNAPFAFFLSRGLPLSLVDAEGGRVCPAAVHDVAACPGLSRAVFFDLSRKRPYRLDLGPADAPEVVVIVEEVF